MAQYGGRPAKSKDRTPLSDGLKDQTPLRITEFKRDILGRLKHTVAHDNKGNTQETVYGYDANGNLVRAANRHGITCFDYNPNGQLIGQHHWKVPTEAESQTLGLPATDWRDPQYDMLYLAQTDSIRYHYDFNGNRSATVLPDGRQINHLYYGSGHLHGILFDGDTVTDIGRDKLHREISRTQGKLTSRYQLDPAGRLKKQIAQLTALTEAKGTGKNKVSTGQTAVSRSYGYDRTGNLTHSTDQRSGTTHFEYDKLGQPLKVQNQTFAFDPACNLIDGYGQQVKDNRIAVYNGIKFFYDDFGNTIHKEHSDGTTQNLYYDLFDRLVKVETFRKNAETDEWEKEVWAFEYDALDRRISKGRLKENGSLENETGFVWDGSHLLQEVYTNGRYTYIYTDVDSYEPLAQIHNYTNAENETYQEVNYFHCDQIGIPREMTDKDGKLLWFGEYDAWGKLTKETNVTGAAHQPFRLQNQYCDAEIGLHYNFFRYYDPDIGRFVNQDPIGLWGGENLYQFAANVTEWIDPLGLVRLPRHLRHKMKRIKNQTASPKINTGVNGAVSEKEAMELGRCFVGENHREMSNGEGLVSSDGLRTFRFPKPKKGINPKTQEPWSKTGKQANFETKAIVDGKPKVVSNVHLDVR